MSDRPIQATVLYSGRVQGVGFRWTAERCARRHAVTGYVQNLSDGRVRLVAEGAAAEVDALLADIQSAMAGNIRATDRVDHQATGSFKDFAIRR